ncbi:hypothetical protein [Pseudoalteromonas luteoviolacea]|uniref:TMhelix containing protein n=1 Tax=Pseudoalteromonas luteoviolacea H33 TaxID=1365251 RepID=A0A167DN34_9GAMM|nr:hypothetical protein [Pseudoalteromonas luteoviolacea]KZN49080.1 hypothetical protein N476_20435 [Pseudoalteromonas luteoviolacea H33]KZN75487.1 hypothetical protein N477_18745 [Pseudoalteromonas luteoviolacea H33-S]MBQ4878790.1 hypothetical protein [Pseudoalteromonas luteoviolacea]MBQ4907802.1 hypothetical protein [Pseudoalteromonas luteoviolacea]
MLNKLLIATVIVVASSTPISVNAYGGFMVSCYKEGTLEWVETVESHYEARFLERICRRNGGTPFVD